MKREEMRLAGRQFGKTTEAFRWAEVEISSLRARCGAQDDEILRLRAELERVTFNHESAMKAKEHYRAELTAERERRQKAQMALRMVLSSALMEQFDHNWLTCEEPSCTLAREALKGDPHEAE